MTRPYDVLALTLLFLFYLAALYFAPPSSFRLVVVVGSFAMVAVLGNSALRIALRAPIAIWTPMFWLRVACLVYYGIGATIPYIANHQTVSRLKANYSFGDATALKVVSIYTLGILLTLVFSQALLAFFGSREQIGRAWAEKGTYPKAVWPTSTYTMAFLLLGGILRYGLVVPYTFGLLGDAVVPGTLVLLSNCYYVGVYLLISNVSKRDVFSIGISIALIVVDAVICVASFAKADLLTLMMFCFLGFMAQRVSWRMVGISAASMMAAFFLLQPLVQYGRDTIQLRYGVIRGAPVSERLDIIAAYLKSDARTGGDGTQDGLIRLSYMAPSAFVVDNFDNGNPGHTFRNAAAVFVPRLFWPGKPVISELGTNLNQQMTGRRGSAVGVGHFAEAYWNFGWIGLPILAAVLASILSLATWFSLGVMARKDWIYLPVVLLGLQMGIRVDGHFVVDILGPAWITLMIFVVITIVGRAVGLIAPAKR